MDDIRDEARSVLREIDAISARRGLAFDRGKRSIDILERFAREQRAAALEGAVRRVAALPVPDDAEHTPSEEQRYHWAIDDSVYAIRALAARLAPPDPGRDEAERARRAPGARVTWAGSPSFRDGTGTISTGPVSKRHPGRVRVVPDSCPDAAWYIEVEALTPEPGPCGTCDGAERTRYWHHGHGDEVVEDCPACTKPNPVSQPTAQSNGDGDAVGRPVTYRAGTVCADCGAAIGEECRRADEYRCVGLYLADREPLARDFTEPRGGECGACAGGGVLPRQHPPDCYEDERGPCTACDGTGRAR
jgi:hypothetical protein